MSTAPGLSRFSTTWQSGESHLATPRHAISVDPVRALVSCGGAARREKLLELGVRRRPLAEALASGAIVRPYRGCYALPEAARVQVVSAMLRVRPTCVNVFEDWDVPLLLGPSKVVHVAVPRDRGVTLSDKRWQSDVVVHRGPDLTGVRALDAPVALAHASHCLDFAALLVAADHLLTTRIIDAQSLEVIPGAVGGRLRALASAGGQSPPETLARLSLVEAGYVPSEQVSFTNVGRVDLVINDCVVVEVDGRSYHSDPAAFVRDRRRDRVLTKDGFRILRFAASEVFADRFIVAREVAGVVGPARGVLLPRTA